LVHTRGARRQKTAMLTYVLFNRPSSINSIERALFVTSYSEITSHPSIFWYIRPKNWNIVCKLMIFL